MKLSKFNKKYRYQRDTDKFDKVEVWEVIQPDSNGMYRGDCESYCLTLKEVVEGFEDMELWFCRLNGEGHCVGKIDGRWIDCNVQAPVSNLGKGYTDFRKYWWIEVVWKRITTKILGYVPFVK